MITFEESTHTYRHTEIDIPFISVSGLLKLVSNPFDPDGSILKKYASKGKDVILKDLAKKWELTQEEAQIKWGHLEMTELDIKEIWEQKAQLSRERGTKLHGIKEQKLYDQKAHRPTIIDNLKYSKDLSNLEVGVHPELILYSTKFGVCGTSDKVMIYPDKTFDIEDFKSNSTIEFKSFEVYNKDTKRRERKMLKSPMNHLEDCDGIKYTLQLSLYAYMLESFGYTCNTLKLQHLIVHDEEIVNEVTYPLNYLKKECFTLLNWYKSKGSTKI